MVETLSNLGAAFGLSTSAGLNAYLPLLIVALTARFTSLIVLRPPFDTLTNGWIIGLLAALLAVEIVADKVPAVDTVNDTVQTFVRPVAGAILFAASTNTIAQLHPVLAMACGLILAGSVHAVKATVRPMVTASSAGVLNPVVSTAEDVVSAVVSVLSLVLPILVGAVLVLAFVSVAAWLLRRHSRRAQSGT